MITVEWSAVDGAVVKKTCGDLAEARAFARKWAGQAFVGPDSTEAWSTDGVGKITAFGCPVYQLFVPEDAPPQWPEFSAGEFAPEGGAER